MRAFHIVFLLWLLFQLELILLQHQAIVDCVAEGLWRSSGQRGENTENALKIYATVLSFSLETRWYLNVFHFRFWNEKRLAYLLFLFFFVAANENEQQSLSPFPFFVHRFIIRY
jgi:hypothetical protein